jgi:pimeloyl-ACP methyl ester carboxylesterase
MTAIITILVLIIALLVFMYFSGPSLPPETDSIIEHVINGETPNVIAGKTGFASSGGLDIWYETIIPEVSPRGTVLLLMSMGGDSLFWSPKFIRALVNAGYQVIRYDHRGTGLSDWVTHWDSKNPYTLPDMANDAIAVLDELDIKQAHLIGLSMGGMVAQEVAINHSTRVASLTLIMTSGFIGDPDLPELTSRFFWSSLIKSFPSLKYRLIGGEKNLIKERIAKTITATGYEGLDIKEIAELVLFDIRKRRGINWKALLQHQTAVSIAGSRFEKLKTLNVPTFVIHGTDDQFIPIEHGKKLVDVIPNAKGLWLDGVGHVFAVTNMEAVLTKIIAHLEPG